MTEEQHARASAIEAAVRELLEGEDDCFRLSILNGIMGRMLAETFGEDHHKLSAAIQMSDSQVRLVALTAAGIDTAEIRRNYH